MANRKNKNPEIVEAEFSVGFFKSLFGKGKFATVNFTKKKDGSERTLNGKSLVVGALVGGEAAYDAESRGQVRVADVNVYTDRKGNRVPRHSEFRTVTISNINWVTSKGKKYVPKVKTHPVLSFIQGIMYNSTNRTLRLMLDGIVYLYFSVPREIYVGLLDASHRGQYFANNIRDKFEYTRIS